MVLHRAECGCTGDAWRRAVSSVSLCGGGGGGCTRGRAFGIGWAAAKVKVAKLTRCTFGQQAGQLATKCVRMHIEVRFLCLVVCHFALLLECKQALRVLAHGAQLIWCRGAFLTRGRRSFFWRREQVLRCQHRIVTRGKWR